MPAYFIAQIEIHDPKEYQNYLDGFMPVFLRHGGELLATSSCKTQVLEGDWAYPSTVIIKFPTMAAANEWYADPDYKTLCKFRHRSADTNFVLVEGLPG